MRNKIISSVLRSLTALIFFHINFVVYGTVGSRNIHSPSIIRFDDGSVEICSNENCFHDLVQVSTPKTIFLVGITNDVTRDSYRGASTPWLLYLFEETKINVKYVLFDTKRLSQERITDVAINIFQYFPSRTIWMSMQHTNGWALDKLLYIRKNAGFLDNYLLHLNHEQPWSKNVSDLRNNQISPGLYGFDDAFISIYEKFKLVIRQYYYEPFLPYSQFVPLGYATLSWPKITYKYPILKSSERSYFCILKARFFYHDQSPFHNERRELLDMQEKNILPCALSKSDSDKKLDDEYFSDYANLLLNTVFIPCPSGNNPETYRHYEALEAGAIPIVIKTDASSSYLSHWGGDYPGPVLESWSQLPRFINNIYPQSTDALQTKLMDWYSRYKTRIIEDLTHALKTVA